MIFTLAIVFLLFAIIGIFFFAYFAWSAKKTLLSDQIVWSAKDIPFKRNKNKGSESIKKRNRSSLLEEIDSQSREFLEIEKDIE